MYKTKKFMAIIAMLLAIVMFAEVPVGAVAAVDDNEDTSIPFNKSSAFMLDESLVGNIIGELDNERTEYTKTFMMDNGSYMVARYDVPVHYKNEKGEWEEYNNTLKAELPDSTLDEATTDEIRIDEELDNVSSDIDVKLSKKSKANNMVKITSDDYSISWGYNDSENVEAKVVDNSEKLSGNNKYTTLNNLSSEVIYENVFKNVDLQYLITSTGVKENIILKKSDVPDEFNITYKVNKLTAKQINDYCITLYDKSGEEVYSILAPYMMDAKGKTSEKIKIELVSQKGANLNVKLILDKDFIRGLLRKYPIVVDPEVITKLNNKISMFNCVNGTATNYGPYSISDNSFTFIRFDDLPELNTGEKITNACLYLETSNGSDILDNADDEPVIIKAHRVTKPTANTYACDEEVVDYDSLSYYDNNNLEFDITSLLKEWYENDVDDVVGFEAEDTIGSRTINIKQPSKSSSKPALCYTYKDFTGTENNLSYHTFAAGHNAMASVSDYLGNLILTQTVSESKGSRMPFSVYLTYNSFNYNKKYENGSPSGLGWQFSFNQSVKETSGLLAENGYNYIYIDSDGTKHYLFKDINNEEWYDEDGIGITLTKDESNVYIDTGFVVQKYELPASGGKLLSETDEYDNVIIYNYTDGNLTSVVDGSGRTTTIYYGTNANNEKRVNKIKAPDGRMIYIYYTSNDKLERVQFSNSMQTKFVYGDNGRIVTVKDEYIAPYTAGQMIAFEYDSEARVNRITELGSDATEGNFVNIQYSDDNTTIFTDRKGRDVTYTFDETGQLISTMNSNGFVTEEDSSDLSLSGGAESFTKNYISNSTGFTGVGNTENSYYYKVDGTKGELTSEGGTCTVDSSTSTTDKKQFLGTTSLKINNPVSSSKSAFFTTIVHKESAVPFVGKNVTFSAYVKTKDVVQIYNGGSVGASLRIVCYDTNGNEIAGTNSSSIGITGTEDWQRLSITGNVPQNASSIKLLCMMRYASGAAWFDCLQLEIGNTASDFNALLNSDFSCSDSWKTNKNSTVSVNNGTVTLQGIPEVFDNQEEELDFDGNVDMEGVTEVTFPTYTREVTETEPYGVVVTYDDYGNEIKNEQGFVIRTVKKTYEGFIDGEPSVPEDQDDGDILGNSYIYQTVDVDRAGVIFNIVGEAQANSVPLTNERRTFGIALNIYYHNQVIPETHYQRFNEFTDSKQTISLSVYPQRESEVIDYVDFAFVYSNNDNTMMVFDSMLNVALSSYSTNESTGGNIGGTDEINEDILVDYEIVSEAVDKTKTYMQTSVSYDQTGNYVTSETDEAGNITTYTYDNRGNVKSVENGEGNTISYEYNAEDNITKISNTDAISTYTYNVGGNVVSITHNDFRYSFNYDVFNKIINTKIGNATLSSNSYSSNNGNLVRTDYANGDYMEYSYDNYDNLIEIVGETGTIAEFVYNKKGLVSKYIDSKNNTTTYYYYDFNGNLTGEYCQADSGALYYYTSVNSNGEQIEKTSVNGQTKTIVYGTDSSGETTASYDGISVNTTSDDFGRIVKVETSKEGVNNSFYTEYTYTSGSANNSTSNYINKIVQKYANEKLVEYSYTYNANGDVAAVSENGDRVAMYNFDDLNQLSWYGDKNTGLYKQFTYDNAGNVLSVKEYNLQTSGWYPGSLIKEYTYSYADTNWKDKLTSFDGNNITYDANGNPLSYRDGMSFTWVNGRTLSSVTKGNSTIAMKYDSNGMRTQKGDTKYYYDTSNNLIGMIKGNNTLLFHYDDSNNPTSLTYNGTMYYYVKNLQGDICKIVNQNGDVVANYTYDVFGKKLDVTNNSGTAITNADSVALLNPLRYRGYVYDEETSLYYLQSRYYDPIIGRFINADSYCDTNSGTPLSTNMFAYCENNAISYVDYSGCSSFNTIQNIYNKANRISSRYVMALTLYGLALKGDMQANIIHDLSYWFSPKVGSSSGYHNFYKNSMRGIDLDALSERMIHQSEFSYYLFMKDRRTGNIEIDNREYKYPNTINYNEDKFSDLCMAIGGIRGIDLVIRRAGPSRLLSNGKRLRNFNITVRLYDYYDFAKFNPKDKGLLLTAINNTFGYKPQQKGKIKNYWWKVEFNYPYSYICKHYF